MNEVYGFFGNSYDPATGTITTQRADMHPDLIPHIGDRYRIGPYLLICTDATDTIISGRLAD